MPIPPTPYKPAPAAASEPAISSAPLEASTPPLTSEPLPPVKYEDLLLSRRLTAKWLLVKEDCLSAWDRKGFGPPVIRMGGRKVGYKVSDVLDWLNRQTGAPDVGRKRHRQAEQISA